MSSDHSIFVRYSSASTIILAVYVDDIVVTGDDHEGIIQLKAYLSFYFHMKDLSLLRYFLGIEVAQSPKGLSWSQRKYLINLLKEIGALGSKSIDIPIDPNIHLDQNLGELLASSGQSRRLIDK